MTIQTPLHAEHQLDQLAGPVCPLAPDADAPPESDSPTRSGITPWR